MQKVFSLVFFLQANTTIYQENIENIEFVHKCALWQATVMEKLH